ncbi:hypothetical protein AGMMS50293_16910 [Spirochaetia bacterium]|nr:hypothetical protein AGMMS50293_16910 [Spirochaetia bacterium]
MEYIFFDENSNIKGINLPKSQVGFEKMCKLCSAAETLFSTKGFYETSIIDISKKARTAVGTFYTYFKNKTAIYNYLVKNYYAIIHRQLAQKTSHCVTRYEMEKEGIKEFIRFGQKNPHCYKIIWGSSHVDPEIFEDYYTNFAQGYISSLKKYQNIYIDVDLSNIVWCLMGVSSFIALKVVFTHKSISEQKLDQLADDIMHILTEGIFKHKPKQRKKDP